MADILKIEDGVLKECTDKNATSVEIPSGVTKIGSGAFMDVKCLKSVVIPDSVAEIGASAFMDCESLTEIKIGRGVKIIGERAFMGAALISIALPEGIERIPRATFYNVKSLREVTISKSVKSVYENAFDGCESLEKAVFSGTVSEWKSIDKKDIFRKAGFVDKVECSDGFVHRPVFSIKDNILWECLAKSAKSLEIPDGVETIWYRAFGGCSRLESVVIPKSVKTIRESSFEDCWSLSNISYLGSRAEWSKVMKEPHWKLNAPANTVKCEGKAKQNANHRYALDLGGWTIEDALSCLNIEPGTAKKWELTYEEYRYGEDTGWNEEQESQKIGYFDTKESAVRYFFENKLYERVKDDYVSCIDCAVLHNELNEESSLEALRDAFSSGGRGEAYYDFYYSLSEVELEALVKPRKTDAEFLEANGIDLTIYDEDEEEDDDEENEEEMRRIEQDAYDEAFVPATWGMH